MIADLSWPGGKLGEGIAALARQGGLAPRSVPAPIPPASPERDDGDDIGSWIEAAADWLHVEAEPAHVPHGGLEAFVRSAGPAILRIQDRGESRFLAVVKGTRNNVVLLGPDLDTHRVSIGAVIQALSDPLERPLIPEVDALLEEAHVPEKLRSKARRGILRERLGSSPIAGCWILKPSLSRSFLRLLQFARLPRRLATLVVAHAVQYLVWILSWWLIGGAYFQGNLDLGLLFAWGLLLLTLVPLRMLVTWSQGTFAVGAGGLLKQRLLVGALKLRPGETRHQGTGQFLGRALESEAMESLALSGGILALMAGIELVGALIVLAAGAVGPLHALLLLGWVGFTAALGWTYFKRRRRWTRTRLGMTHDLVEQMVGHRTRLAQERRERWHEGEDQGLERYLDSSRRMDRTAVGLMVVAPRGWLILGLVGFGVAFVAGTHSPGSLAVALGGVLLALQALEKLSVGFWDLAEARVAWEQISPLYRAAARRETESPPDFASSGRRPSADGQPLLEANGLTYRFRERHEPVLRGCDLRVKQGDRFLLEGPSGGGKSTLASLLAGLRDPESGLLLSLGLDRQTLGTRGWRKRVVVAPQFHENYVMTETFLFNLLMGRRWPPRRGDVEEAQRICEEVGLREVIERMPSGLLQMVGETGWQLSHGERSRLFIARALLQDADLVILDESFAALDPENLRRAVACVVDRSRALLVIAHP